MLERLRIQNFQCHERLEIVFDERITCLVGPSDRGKSAVVRALRWLFSNRPSGDTFVRRVDNQVCGGVSVRLKVDKRAIGRRRGGRAGNTYTLDRRTLRAFGVGTPDVVARLLNVADVNLQAQHAGPFWLALSPGECARALNEVVNLSLIDRTLTAAGKGVRKAKAQVEASQERLEEARRRRDELAWVVEADTALREAEEAYTKVNLIRNKREALRDLVEEGSRLVSEQDRSSDASLRGFRAVETGRRVLQLQRRMDELRDLVHTIRETNSELIRAGQAVDSTEIRLKREIQGKVCPVCGKKLR